jgi:hypothetical protein
MVPLLLDDDDELDDMIRFNNRILIDSSCIRHVSRMQTCGAEIGTLHYPMIDCGHPPPIS